MKFKTYVVFFLLIGVLTDLFFCLTLMKAAPLAWKVIVCIPTLAAGVCLTFVGLGKHYTDSLRVMSYIIFIFFVSRHLVVNHTELSFERLPESAIGLKICHIGDFHLGSFGRMSPYIQRIVEAINAQNPDVILFSGDLVNFESKEALPYGKTLKALKAAVYSCMGNHDFLLHGPHDGNEDSRKEDMDRLEEFEKSIGWTVLRNCNIELRPGISLIGVDNITKNPYFQKVGGNLKKAMEGILSQNLKILLSHDPTHWRMEVVPDTDIDLTLSGHTHGLKEKGRKGQFLYTMVAPISTFARKRHKVEVTLDGELAYSGRLFTATLGNGAYRGGGLIQTAQDTKWDDGLLDISIMPGVNHFKGMQMMMHCLSGDLAVQPGMVTRKFKKMTIKPLDNGADIVEVDGEITGTLPLTMEVTGEQINIIVA